MVRERDSTTEGTRDTHLRLRSPLSRDRLDAATMPEMTTVYRETVDRIPLNFKNEMISADLLKRQEKKSIRQS